MQSLDGSARTFAHGEWSPVALGATLTPKLTVETAGDARMRVNYAGDALTLGAFTKIRIEQLDGPLVRALAGSLDVEIAPAEGAGLLVMTTYAAIEAADADFAIAVEPQGATVSVRRGAVAVTDLATHNAVEVREGQVLRVRGGTPNIPEMALAAGRAVAAKGIEWATWAAPQLAGLAQRSDVREVDPRAVAAAARLDRAAFAEGDYEPEPWDHNFKWTETDGGAVRLKPISQIVLGLRAPQACEFWFMAFLACLFAGGGANALRERTGMNAVQSALVVALAFVVAILIRDVFFRAGANIAIEPFLSGGMMLAAVAAAFIGGSFAKERLAA